MKNNITPIGINFYPEDSSTGLYSTQMVEHLAKLNHMQNSNHWLEKFLGQKMWLYFKENEM